MSLGIPTQIALGVLGMGANLDRDAGPGGVFQFGRIAELGRI